MKVVSSLLLLLVLSPVVLRGDVQLDVTAADLRTHDGSALLAPGRLVQLVNLGPNGVFDAVPAGAWVGGDDRLVTFSFGSTEWPSAAGFDFAETDPGSPDDPGVLQRSLVFNTGSLLASGTAIGIRWFEGFAASDYYNGALPAAGAFYGEFTRAMPVNGGEAWVFPADGNVVTLDPLLTLSAGGADSNSAGFASRQVITAVPEASTVFAGALAVLGVTGERLRRRRLAARAAA